MRAIWKGAITFGLVNVPVKLYSATEDHDIGLHQVHDADGGRIRYKRTCEVCGKVIDYGHIAKAYDDGERTVVLTSDDLSSLPVERSREIDVVEFVPADQIDPLMYEHAYYLEPDSKSIKSYALLVRTLEASDRVAVVNFSLRQRSRLGALRVREGVLTLQILRWDDEVREASFPSLDEDVRISQKELDMAATLVESFESDFTPEKFTDEYTEQLQMLIDAKLEQGDAVDTAATFGEQPEDEEGEGAQVVDLMEVLRRSVEKSRGGSGGTSSVARTTTKADAKRTTKAADDEPDATSSGTRSATKAPAKKTGEKKASAKTTSGEKAPEKKTTAKKAPAKKAPARKTAEKDAEKKESA